MISHKLRLTLLLSAIFSIALLGQPAVRAVAAEPWVIIQPDALAWAPFAGLPPGTEVAALYGDFSKAEPYGVRVKFPAGYEVANHSHPTAELITVVSGKLFMAFGEHGNLPCLLSSGRSWRIECGIVLAGQGDRFAAASPTLTGLRALPLSFRR